MNLSQLLNRSPTFQPVALAAFNQLSAAADRIRARWPDVVKEPPERDRERIVQDVKRRFDTDNWRDTRMALITSAAVALFDKDRRDRPDLADLRHFYYREIVSSDRPTFLNSMVAVYFGSYVVGAHHTSALADALTSVKDRIGGRWTALLAEIPECLHARKAPAALSARMGSMTSPWNDLRQLGMRSPHASGLMDIAHLQFVHDLAPRLGQRGQMERLIEWLKPENKEAKVSGAAEAISALLTPWQNESPSQANERYLTERLISLYGDPRVTRGGAWEHVGEPLKAIIIRWLTGENIRLFLKVVSDVEDNHMWEPRRKFWLGLYEQKLVDAAWVAFSREASENASRNFSANKFLKYGHQQAGGGDAKKSLLILQVGNKIVVEGSHNFKVHVFQGDAKRAPKLFETSYDCQIIRDLPGSWSTMHLGDWQSRVLEHI